jgi:hypothetical protein
MRRTPHLRGIKRGLTKKQDECRLFLDENNTASFVRNTVQTIRLRIDLATGSNRQMSAAERPGDDRVHNMR